MSIEKLKRYWPELLLLFLILFFLKDIIFFGRIFTSPAIGLSDYSLVTTPYLSYLSESLKGGRIPLWNPEIQAGIPFVGNGESGLLYPLNIILSVLFPLATAANLYVVFTFLIMGFSMLYFLRNLNIPKSSALVGTLSFIFAAGLVSRMVHMQILGTIAFLPLSFLLVRKYFDKGSGILLAFLSIVLSLQILNYHPQATLICFMAVSLYFLYSVFTSSSFSGKKATLRIFQFIIVVLVSFSLSAIQLIPSFEYLSYSERKAGLVTSTRTSDYPFHIGELSYFFRPTPFGNPSLGTYQSQYEDFGLFWENNAYIGIAGLFFSFIALVFLSKTQKSVRFFGALFLFSVILALGKFTPFSFILKTPPFSFFRIPSRYLILSMFSLSVLASYGFQGITQWLPKSKRSILLPIVVIFILIDLFPFDLSYNLTYDSKNWLSPPQSVHFIKEDETFFRIYTFGEMGNSQFVGWRGNDGWFYNLRESVAPNSNLFYGINHAEGNLGLLTERSGNWVNYLAENIKANYKNEAFITDQVLRMLRLKNVKYIIAPFKSENKELSLRKEIDFASEQLPYYVYELRNPLPHAFLVNDSITIDKSDVMGKLLADDFDPERTVVLEEMPSNEAGNPPSNQDGVEMIEYLPERVTVRTKTDNPAFLILTDTNYPGWEVKVNGNPAKIFQANYLFRAVEVEAGESEVVFEFKPISFYIGAGVTAITVLVVAVYCIVFFVRRKLKK